MRISDWSSDVCSSDLRLPRVFTSAITLRVAHRVGSYKITSTHICRSNCVPVGAFLRCSGGQRRGPPRLLVANHGVEHAQQVTHRSEERRVGKECVSTCRSGWSPYT